MTQEDKDLLLKDLCARLPYGVKIRLGDYDYQVCGYDSEKEMPMKIWYYYNSNRTLKSYIDVYLTDYRPYLRPMSSMTEEEKHKLLKFGAITCLKNGEVIDVSCVGFEIHADVQDYLNAHHFDYRNLIPKGLAIEITKENNPYENDI